MSVVFWMIDDIIIYSQNYEDDLLYLQQVFDRLAQVNMKLKSDKCYFAREQLVYLGVTISKHGTRPNSAGAAGSMGIKHHTWSREYRI